MAEASKGRPIDGDLELLKTGRFSDLTIVCGDKVFKVHRAIVCLRCPFFDKQVATLPRNMNMKFGKEDPVIMQHVLAFLYLGVLDGDPIEERPDLIVKLYGAGKYFELPRLSTLAMDHFHSYLCDTCKGGNKAFPRLEQMVKEVYKPDRRSLNAELREFLMDLTGYAVRTLNPDQGIEGLMSINKDYARDLSWLLATRVRTDEPGAEQWKKRKVND